MDLVYYVKVGMVILALLAFTSIALFAVMSRKKGRGMSNYEKERIAAQLKQINILLNDESYDSAVMKADKLVDHAMHVLGYPGTFKDKAVAAEDRFKDYDGLWKAHKLRNEIAHTINFEVKKGEAKKAVDTFKRALKDLKAL